MYGHFPTTPALVPNPVDGNVPAGDVISVYTGNPNNGGILMYSQTVTGSAANYDFVITPTDLAAAPASAPVVSSFGAVTTNAVTSGNLLPNSFSVGPVSSSVTM